MVLKKCSRGRPARVALSVAAALSVLGLQEVLGGATERLVQFHSDGHPLPEAVIPVSLVRLSYEHDEDAGEALAEEHNPRDDRRPRQRREHASPEVFTATWQAAAAPGAVIPMESMRQSHFMGRVAVGTPPQQLRLIFDTGSTNVQVVGNKCVDATCVKVHRFNPELSETFQPLDNGALDITFGTGSVKTELAKDTVLVGPYRVDDQVIGVITREKDDPASGGSIFGRIQFEGLMGFGFPSLATEHYVPFFDKLMSTMPAGVQPLFAIYMGVQENGDASNKKIDTSKKMHAAEDGSASFAKSSEDPSPAVSEVASAFFIGGVDPVFYHPPIRYVPVIKEHYWQVALLGLYVGDHQLCCDNVPASAGALPPSVIIDSGTTFNTVPVDQMDELIQLVPPATCDAVQDYPIIKYVLANGLTLEFGPDAYMVRNRRRATDTAPAGTETVMCHPAYMHIDVPPSFGRAYLLGSTVFMQNYFTVFRRGVREGELSMVGIAPARHSPEGFRLLEKQAGTEAAGGGR